jgi:hypothetical protein
LAAIPAGVVVPFFFGSSQKSVPKDFMLTALQLGKERFIPINIQGQGKNALDFHIAFYLGEYLTKYSQTQCVILSKDKGFDPLVKHLVNRKFTVSRVTTLAEAFPPQSSAVPGKSRPSVPAKVKPVAASPVENALAWLNGMEKGKRPKKRKALVSHLHSHFARKEPMAAIERMVDRMIGDQKLAESAGKISYRF